MNTRATIAILIATVMVFSLILLEPLQANAAGPNAPGAPTSVAAVGNADSILVSWVAPTTGVAAAAYEISWQPAGTPDDPYYFNELRQPGSFQYVGQISTYFFPLPPLAPGFYDVRIKAVAAACASEDCYSVPVYVAAVEARVASAGAPGAPTSVTAVGNADSILVSWVAPTTGVAVARYEISWKTAGSLDAQYSNWDQAGSVLRSYDVRALIRGFYDVRIQAVAAACDSEACYSTAVVSSSVEVGAPIVEPRVPTVTPGEQAVAPGVPTTQPEAGQGLPEPGSKLQADLIGKVSRSKLGIGGTAQFSVTGGEPGATLFFESKNTRICSINARGLVTAKSTGVCLISATATAQDPVFAPASAPITKIVVLGPGLINNAKVTELNGQVSIKASLLKSLAGKSVKLALEVKRAGKSVLVTTQSEVLSKSATATFKSFAKPRPGTRVVLTIRGRAVYALTL